MLNEKQQQVANTLDRNILLVASAGTGKTSTLASRMENIIAGNKALPEEILCITFTNRACKELEKKIKGLVGGEDVVIKTIHSFCYDIIRAETKNSSSSSDFVIFDEDDCKEIIAELEHGAQRLGPLQNFINLVKHYRSLYGIYSENLELDYLEVVKQLFEKEKQRLLALDSYSTYSQGSDLQNYLREHGASLVSLYDRELERFCALDFNDLILRVYEMFKREDVKDRWRKKFKYIMLDEMQDTSLFEYEILSSLFAGNNVLLCGDYFQTIYEWRGSDPAMLLESFRKEWDPVDISFAENYRSTKTLLQASFACLQSLFPEKVAAVYQEPFSAVSDICGESIALKNAEQAEEEARWIFTRIQQLKVEDFSQIGVLTRNNRYNQVLSEYFSQFNEELLEEKRLKFILVDEFKFFRRQEIKDVLAGLRLLLNPYDASSLKRLIKRFSPGIGERTLAAADSLTCQKMGLKLGDFITFQVQTGRDPFEPLAEALVAENIVVFDVESTGLDTEQEDIVQIAAVRLDGKGAELAVFERFLQPRKSVGDSAVVHGFSDAFLQEHGEPADVVLQDFLDFAKDAVIVGHNVNYDIEILRSQLRRQHIEAAGFALCVYDTLDLYRRFYPGLKNYKLGFLGSTFSVKKRPAHDALQDVLTTADLLIHVVNDRILPGKEQRKEHLSAYKDAFAETAIGLQQLFQASLGKRVPMMIAEIVDKLGIKEYYEKHRQPERIDRIREMYLMAKEMDQEKMSSQKALIDFLKTAALSNSEFDRLLEKRPRIPILTIHQAKGSEFEYEFLAGLQEGIFPSYQSLKKKNMEEEQRLFYVAITRAKKRLFLSWSRKYNGKILQKSRFIDSIPKKFIEAAEAEGSLFANN